MCVERHLLVNGDSLQVTSSIWRPQNTVRKVNIPISLVDHRKLLSVIEPDNIWLISIEFQSVRTAPEFNVYNAVDHCALLCVDLTDKHMFTELWVISKSMEQYYMSVGNNEPLDGKMKSYCLSLSLCLSISSRRLCSSSCLCRSSSSCRSRSTLARRTSLARRCSAILCRLLASSCSRICWACSSCCCFSHQPTTSTVSYHTSSTDKKVKVKCAILLLECRRGAHLPS